MRESRRTRQFLNTSPSSSYFTLARGGYIIRISPIAIGILVVPTWNWFQKSTTPGNTKPQPTPMNMARKIHSVKNLSRKESFLLSCSVAICFPLKNSVFSFVSPWLVFYVQPLSLEKPAHRQRNHRRASLLELLASFWHLPWPSRDETALFLGIRDVSPPVLQEGLSKNNASTFPPFCSG